MTIVFYSNNFASFSTFFTSSGKQKVLRISEITQHFQKWFTDYDRGTSALPKKCTTGVYLLILFLLENGLHRKGETSNIFGAIQPIFFNSFTICFENNGLLNKNYWNDLDIIIRGSSVPHGAMVSLPLLAFTVTARCWRSVDTDRPDARANPAGCKNEAQNDWWALSWRPTVFYYSCYMLCFWSLLLSNARPICIDFA